MPYFNINVMADTVERIVFDASTTKALQGIDAISEAMTGSNAGVIAYSQSLLSAGAASNALGIALLSSSASMLSIGANAYKASLGITSLATSYYSAATAAVSFSRSSLSATLARKGIFASTPLPSTGAGGGSPVLPQTGDAGRKIIDVGASAGRATEPIKRMSSAAKENTSSLNGLSIAGIATTAMFAGLALGVGKAFKGASDAAGSFEQLQVTMKVMLGGVEKSTALLSELESYAVKSPMTFIELADSMRKLLAYGVESEDVIDTLKRLGDIAAGTAQPIGEIAYIYGKVTSAGRLYADELMRMQERAIPIQQTMVKQLNITNIEFKKMLENGKIGASAMHNAIKALTDEGGKFYNLQAEQSKTWKGLWSNLADITGFAMRDIGTQINEGLKGTLRDTIEQIGELRPELIKFGVSIKEGLLLAAESIKEITTWFVNNGAVIMDYIKRYGPLAAKIIGVAAIIKTASFLFGTMSKVVMGLIGVFAGFGNTVTSTAAKVTLLSTAVNGLSTRYKALAISANTAGTAISASSNKGMLSGMLASGKGKLGGLKGVGAIAAVGALEYATQGTKFGANLDDATSIGINGVMSFATAVTACIPGLQGLAVALAGITLGYNYLDNTLSSSVKANAATEKAMSVSGGFRTSMMTTIGESIGDAGTAMSIDLNKRSKEVAFSEIQKEYESRQKEIEKLFRTPGLSIDQENLIREQRANLEKEWAGGNIREFLWGAERFSSGRGVYEKRIRDEENKRKERDKYNLNKQAEDSARNRYVGIKEEAKKLTEKGLPELKGSEREAYWKNLKEQTLASANAITGKSVLKYNIKVKGTQDILKILEMREKSGDVLTQGSEDVEKLQEYLAELQRIRDEEQKLSKERLDAIQEQNDRLVAITQYRAETAMAELSALGASPKALEEYERQLRITQETKKLVDQGMSKGEALQLARQRSDAEKKSEENDRLIQSMNSYRLATTGDLASAGWKDALAGNSDVLNRTLTQQSRQTSLQEKMTDYLRIISDSITTKKPTPTWG